MADGLFRAAPIRSAKATSGAPRASTTTSAPQPEMQSSGIVRHRTGRVKGALLVGASESISMDDREAKRPKFKQVFSSPSEHYLLEGLPAGWELEAVPRGAGQKHVDYYWLSPPDPSTGKVKRLRSMNEVRSFLNPETAMLERAKRIDHDKEAVRRVVESLIQRVEKRCGQGEKRPGGGGGQGGYRRPLPMRTAAEIMRVHARPRAAGRADVCAARGVRLRAAAHARLLAPPPPIATAVRAGAAERVHALRHRAAPQRAAGADGRTARRCARVRRRVARAQRGGAAAL